MASTLQHGSHGHPLHLMQTMETKAGTPNCRACNLPITATNEFFGCRICGFFLHRNCILLPASRVHPAHQQHPLRLLYAPAYSGGVFRCNICGDVGNGFNYNCQTCQFDAHVLCVNLPRKARSPAHQGHPLQLLFRPPANMGGTSCGVCGLQIQYCCYSCSRCSFFLHPQCLNRQPPNNQQGPNIQRDRANQNRPNLGNVFLGAVVSGVVRGGISLLGGIDVPGIDIGGWFDDAVGEDGGDWGDDFDDDDDLGDGYVDPSLQ